MAIIKKIPPKAVAKIAGVAFPASGSAGLVGVGVSVLERGVSVGVLAGVFVGVLVGAPVSVGVGEDEGVPVGVSVSVGVGVGVVVWRGVSVAVGIVGVGVSVANEKESCWHALVSCGVGVGSLL